MLVRYDRGLLQVSNAIFKYFGLDTYHDIDLQVENWLNEHEFETLIVLLIDGMGSRIIKEILKPNDFLVKYMTKEMPSVFPPTTTAATTSFLTGKSPKETGWLGWSQYFKEVDDSVVLFRNCSLYNDKLYPNFNERLKNKSLMDYLAERNISFKTIYPSWDINGTDNLEEFVEKSRLIHGNKYNYSKVQYINANIPVCIICNKCGNEFWQTPGNHLSGKGCGNCFKSHLEEEVESLLIKNEIEYIPQCNKKYFKWLDKSSFDFYIKYLNLAIECQGVQHFKPLEIFGGKNEFEKQTMRDIKKYNLCKENGIELIYLLSKEKIDLTVINSIQEIYQENNTFKNIEDLINYINNK